MQSKYTIIGAGMAGLLAGGILREECDSILEAQSSLPNNHAALLRFRSSIVGDALNIPFKKVDVIKGVQSTGNPVADAISYSIKTNGTATLRSVISAQGEIESRYIAPPDFISRMAMKVTAPIAFDINWKPICLGGQKIISTLPMPVLMKLLDYKCEEKFESRPGVVVTATLRDCNVCATVYLPSRDWFAYRASITGNQLIIEYSGEYNEELLANQIGRYLQLFGMDRSFIIGEPTTKAQRYAKILPIDDSERKKFILWASDHHGIYSFGRFATWRPGLLLDDLVSDLRLIQRLANGGTNYSERKA